MAGCGHPTLTAAGGEPVLFNAVCLRLFNHYSGWQGDTWLTVWEIVWHVMLEAEGCLQDCRAMYGRYYATETLEVH